MHGMSSKLRNSLQLFTNIERSVGTLFTADLLHKFTQVEDKEVCLMECALNLKIFIFLIRNTIVKLVLS